MSISTAFAAGWARAFPSLAPNTPLATGTGSTSPAIDHFSSLPVDAFYHVRINLSFNRKQKC